MNDFSEQWLEVRNLQAIEPDPTLFPASTTRCARRWLKETELFFESQVREDRPVQELLRANYTFLNERLARHYGITDVYGSHFRRVTLTDERRHGLLGHAQRPDGDVVREPDVGRAARQVGAREPARRAAAAAAAERAAAQGERRARASRRRCASGWSSIGTTPVCASCHARMDPLGFALENFDAIGQWRENDDGRADQLGDHARRAQTIDSPKAFREALLHQDRRVRPDGHREAADLRARPRPRLLRRADGAAARARPGAQRLPLVVAHPRHRPERAVPDAADRPRRRRTPADTASSRTVRQPRAGRGDAS